MYIGLLRGKHSWIWLAGSLTEWSWWAALYNNVTKPSFTRSRFDPLTQSLLYLFALFFFVISSGKIELEDALCDDFKLARWVASWLNGMHTQWLCWIHGGARSTAFLTRCPVSPVPAIFLRTSIHTPDAVTLTRDCKRVPSQMYSSSSV